LKQSVTGITIERVVACDVHKIVTGPKEQFFVAGNGRVEGCNLGFSNIGIAVATLDLDLVNLVVGQGGLEWKDAVMIFNRGLVCVSSTTSSSIATATAAATAMSTTMSTTIAVSALPTHLERSIGLSEGLKQQ